MFIAWKVQRASMLGDTIQYPWPKQGARRGSRDPYPWRCARERRPGRHLCPPW